MGIINRDSPHHAEFLVCGSLTTEDVCVGL